MGIHRYNMQLGEWEETHLVAQGESLSMIAAHYASKGWRDVGATNWRPIFNLTRERTGLWRDNNKSAQLDNPNLIHPNDLLVIPRSRAGYFRAINRVDELFRDAQNAPNYAASLKKQSDEFGEGLDLLSDALTFVATAGVSAAKAVKSAKFAKNVVGLAAKQFLKEKGLASAEMGLKIAEYGAKSTGHEKLATTTHVAAKMVHVADLAHGAKGFAKESQELAKKKEYWRLGGEGLGQVVDVIDVALEWTQPSKISKGLLRLFTGTDVDATIDQAMEAEKRSRAQLCRMLQTKVAALQREMNLVYC